MGFYKRDGDQLLHAPNGVMSPEGELHADNHTEYTYPVDGWYWFDTLDDALNGLPRESGIPYTPGYAGTYITKRQAVLALYHAGLLDSLNQALAAAPEIIKITWDATAILLRDDPMISQMQAILGWTNTQVDQLFSDAIKF